MVGNGEGGLFSFFVPLPVSSFSSVAIWLSGIRATPFALSVGGEALTEGFCLGELMCL
jgi:hypothetical protein